MPHGKGGSMRTRHPSDELERIKRELANRAEDLNPLYFENRSFSSAGSS
jgi:hypothetical protein